MDIRSLKATRVTLAEAHSGDQFSPWCFSRKKRWFDCVVSAIALVVSTPLLLLIAAALKASAPRERVLFRHRRVGEGGREFDVLKFRTMTSARSKAGGNLTSANDDRVTGVGRLLRRSKLDELPQLANVLLGEMSLVGPRPDTKDFIYSLPPQLFEILMLRPGVTGVASLRFRNEEALFAQVSPEMLSEHYVQVVLPEKVRLDLEYARGATFWSDLRILFRTAVALAD